jgi:hypothetical protein
VEASHWLPKNFQDMAQVHLATWSPILNPCSVNAPPFHWSYGISLCSLAI